MKLKAFSEDDMKKLYFLFFYKIICFCKKTHSSKTKYSDVWRAGLMIQTLQIFILAIAFFQLEIFMKKSLINPNLDPKLFAIPIALTFAMLNTQIFSALNRTKRYEEEFKRFSHSLNFKINFVIAAIYILVFCVFVLTMYQLGNLDWSNIS